MVVGFKSRLFSIRAHKLNHCATSKEKRIIKTDRIIITTIIIMTLVMALFICRHYSKQ